MGVQGEPESPLEPTQKEEEEVSYQAFVGFLT